jgi:hydroxymethylbilane synthase
LTDRIREILDVTVMLPSAGQGALGLEIMANQTHLHALLQRLNHNPTLWCTHAERQVSRALGGSCAMPLAAYAHLDHDQMTLTALLGHPQHTGLLRAQQQAQVLQLDQAVALGQVVAQQLIDAGAHQWLADLQ